MSNYIAVSSGLGATAALRRHALAQYFSIHPLDPTAAAVTPGRRDRSQRWRHRLSDGFELRIRLPNRGCQRPPSAFGACARVDDKHQLTLVCRDLAEIGRYALLDNAQFRIVKRGVPGSYTFLLPATREVPRRLKHPNRSTIGVRVPDHAVVQGLLADLDEPLLSSTLIPAGATEPLNDPQIIKALYEHTVDLIIDSGACHLEPTTVIDLAVYPPSVTRYGRGDTARLGLATASQ